MLTGDACRNWPCSAALVWLGWTSQRWFRCRPPSPAEWDITAAFGLTGGRRTQSSPHPTPRRAVLTFAHPDSLAVVLPRAALALPGPRLARRYPPARCARVAPPIRGAARTRRGGRRCEREALRKGGGRGQSNSTTNAPLVCFFPTPLQVYKSGSSSRAWEPREPSWLAS